MLEHGSGVKRPATEEMQFNVGITELKTFDLSLERKLTYQLFVAKFNQYLLQVKPYFLAANYALWFLE